MLFLCGRRALDEAALVDVEDGAGVVAVVSEGEAELDAVGVSALTSLLQSVVVILKVDTNISNYILASLSSGSWWR